MERTNEEVQSLNNPGFASLKASDKEAPLLSLTLQVQIHKELDITIGL